MKAGVAEIDITPPIGCWNCGPMRPSTGIYDPLTATALVLEDAHGRRIAVVGQDLLCVDWNLTEACINTAADRIGADLVIINSSHTHNAPLYPCGPSMVKDQEEALGDWPNRLPEFIATIVEKAASRLVPVNLSCARAPVQIGFNRRLMNDEKEMLAKARLEGDEVKVREASDRIHAMYELQKIVKTGEKIDFRAELFTFRIGRQFCMSAIGAETFCEYQLWIDKNSPFRRNMVLGYCGGSDGYLASDDELALKERGGYEAGAWPCTWALSLTMPQRLAIEVGAEKLIRSQFEDMWRSL